MATAHHLYRDEHDRNADIDVEADDLEVGDAELAEVEEGYLDLDDADAADYADGKPDSADAAGLPKQAHVTKLQHLVADNLATNTEMAAASAEDLKFAAHIEGADLEDLLRPTRGAPNTSRPTGVDENKNRRKDLLNLRSIQFASRVANWDNISYQDPEDDVYVSSSQADWAWQEAHYAVQVCPWLRYRYPDLYVYAWNHKVQHFAQWDIAQAFGKDRTEVSKSVSRARELYERRRSESFTDATMAGDPPRKLRRLLGEKPWAVLDFNDVCQADDHRRDPRIRAGRLRVLPSEALHREQEARRACDSYRGPNRSIWIPTLDELAAMDEEHLAYANAVYCNMPLSTYCLWLEAHPQYNRSLSQLARRHRWDAEQARQSGFILQGLWDMFRKWRVEWGQPPVQFPCPHLLPPELETTNATPRADGRHVRGEATLQRVWEAIRDLCATLGRPPSVDEVRKHGGWSSKGEVFRNVKRLREQGRVAPHALMVNEA